MPTRLAVKSPRLFVYILAAACCLSAAESKSDDAEKAAPSATVSMVGKKAGELRDDNQLKMKLVWCPPGAFKMGSPRSEADRNADEDQVEVTLTVGMWIGRYEVTQSEWVRVIATEPWKDKPLVGQGDDFPATFVSWDAAMDFCRRLTEQERTSGRLPEGWEYTLPTEAQWEYACRAGTATRYSFGNDASKAREFAWADENTSDAGEGFAHRVGQKKPNGWGSFDTYGNVWELCLDQYVFELPGGSDPVGRSDRPARVIRGAGWTNAAEDCRSAFRTRCHPSDEDECLGFRVALNSVRRASRDAPDAIDK